jgi:hypothetical protein
LFLPRGHGYRGHDNGRNSGRVGNRFLGRSHNVNNKKSNGVIRSGKPGECKDLGDNIYFIGDARQADNYTKITESILRYIQKTYNDGTLVKQALEDSKDFHFDNIKHVMPQIARVNNVGDTEMVDAPKDSIEMMLSRAEIKEYITKKSRYINNMHTAYML